MYALAPASADVTVQRSVWPQEEKHLTGVFLDFAELNSLSFLILELIRISPMSTLSAVYSTLASPEKALAAGGSFRTFAQVVAASQASTFC
jgi:hypothetical protein